MRGVYRHLTVADPTAGDHLPHEIAEIPELVRLGGIEVQRLSPDRRGGGFGEERQRPRGDTCRLPRRQWFSQRIPRWLAGS